jgi:ABC-type lipoprotein release transport system permease subunit
VVTREIEGVRQLGPVTTATVPAEIERLHQIDWLPVALAGFLAALALIAIGHALVTSVRERRRELALLRTFGFTRRQLRSTIAWQATSFAVVGLALGTPLGVVVGTTAWRLVANGLGVAVVQVVPILLLSATILGVVAAVNLIALVPARSAATTAPAIAFRAE